MKKIILPIILILPVFFSCNKNSVVAPVVSPVENLVSGDAKWNVIAYAEYTTNGIVTKDTSSGNFTFMANNVLEKNLDGSTSFGYWSGNNTNLTIGESITNKVDYTNVSNSTTFQRWKSDYSVVNAGQTTFVKVDLNLYK